MCHWKLVTCLLHLGSFPLLFNNLLWFSVDYLALEKSCSFILILSQIVVVVRFFYFIRRFVLFSSCWFFFFFFVSSILLLSERFDFKHGQNKDTAFWPNKWSAFHIRCFFFFSFIWIFWTHSVSFVHSVNSNQYFVYLLLILVSFFSFSFPQTTMFAHTYLLGEHFLLVFTNNKTQS